MAFERFVFRVFLTIFDRFSGAILSTFTACIGPFWGVTIVSYWGDFGPFLGRVEHIIVSTNENVRKAAGYAWRCPGGGGGLRGSQIHLLGIVRP